MRENKNRYIKVRVTEKEEERMKELASNAGVTLSEYLRRRGLQKRRLTGKKQTTKARVEND